MDTSGFDSDEIKARFKRYKKADEWAEKRIEKQKGLGDGAQVPEKDFIFVVYTGPRASEVGPVGILTGQAYGSEGSSSIIVKWEAVTPDGKPIESVRDSRFEGFMGTQWGGERLMGRDKVKVITREEAERRIAGRSERLSRTQDRKNKDFRIKVNRWIKQLEEGTFWQDPPKLVEFYADEYGGWGESLLSKEDWANMVSAAERGIEPMVQKAREQHESWAQSHSHMKQKPFNEQYWRDYGQRIADNIKRLAESN